MAEASRIAPSYFPFDGVSKVDPNPETIEVTLLSMRGIPLCTLATALLAQAVEAQSTYDQDKMKATYAEMQTHDWFSSGAWITDFDAAKTKAKESGRPIFAYFTRTYAP